MGLMEMKARERARLSLEGLSLGDAFGQMFFVPRAVSQAWIVEAALPPKPWYVTDDTLMGCSIVRILEGEGQIDQEALAEDFALTYAAHSDRGYGGTAHRILRQLGQGISWRVAAQEVFDGMGSMGNGAAMRAAPLGAFFAGDLTRVVEQALLSAQVTHAHPDAQAGAVAIALAAALLVCEEEQRLCGRDWLHQIEEHLPSGQLQAKVRAACRLPLEYSMQTAAHVLGNGSQLLAVDTVPLVLWCVAKFQGAWEKIMWSLVRAEGDMDTTCAIAGSLAILWRGQHSIPKDWFHAREGLDTWLVPSKSSQTAQGTFAVL